MVVQGRKDVEFCGLKNSIVKEMSIKNEDTEFVAFPDKLFQRIKNLLGGQLLPINEFHIKFQDARFPSTNLQELSHFRDIYSSMLLKKF